jgi:hypothetical protein
MVISKEMVETVPPYVLPQYLPDFREAQISRRAVPDVDLKATPNASQSWEVYVGKDLIPDGLAPVGGTSAASDVTTGTNTDIDPHSPLALWKHHFPGYSAGPGYDLVTGWGSINYPNMLKAFRDGQAILSLADQGRRERSKSVHSVRGCASGRSREHKNLGDYRILTPK